MAEMRLERDSMGEMQVPSEAYYGVQTQRAVENFPISGQAIPIPFVVAHAMLKKAAAQTNMELGLLEKKLGEAICQACDEIAKGDPRFAADFKAHFPVDVYQTGSGTSTNMNVNEVVASRANEILGGGGGGRGDKSPVHPNDHVNMGQSSNDTIPTSLHVMALFEVRNDLRPALAQLHTALMKKSEEFWPVIKTGRTHLQDATPIRMGQVFLGYAGQVERGMHRLDAALRDIEEVPLGGTAVGTGINAHREYAARVCAKLSERLGISVRETTNHFQAQATLDGAAHFHAALKTIAISLTKIASDIRWMGSGPRAGLGELELPAVQPGSSIMPGKVNPVIAESLLMVCQRVVGNDATVTAAAMAANFELVVTLPVVAQCLDESITLLAAGARNFALQCVEGLKATERGPALVEQGLMLATALAPVIGYDAAAAIAKEAAKSGRTVREVARERTTLSEEALGKLLDPATMVEPGAKE